MLKDLGLLGIPFVMLDFKQVAIDAKWLWVSTKGRAVAFLMVIGITGTIVLYFTIWPPWQFILQHIELTSDAPVALQMAKKLAIDTPVDTFKIILLGGSTSRELTSHDEIVSETLTSKTGQKICFVNAGTSSQNLSEVWTFGSGLSGNAPDMVVIGMNYYRFSEDRIAIKKNISQNVYPLPLSRSMLFDNLSWLSTLPPVEPITQSGRLLSFHRYIKKVSINKIERRNTNKISPDSLFSGPRNRYKKPVFSKEQKEQRVTQFIANRGPQFFQTHQESFGLWANLIADMRSKGVIVLVLILPLSPEMDQARVLFDPLFDPMIEKLDQIGAIVIDWRDLESLKSEDFYDQQHLVKSGRKKIFSLLVGDIASCVPIASVVSRKTGIIK